MVKDTAAGYRDPYTLKAAPTIQSLALINLSLRVQELVGENQHQDLMQLLWEATLGTATLTGSYGDTAPGGTLTARINALIKAAREDAFAGAQPPEDREAIRDALTLARQRLTQHVVTMCKAGA